MDKNDLSNVRGDEPVKGGTPLQAVGNALEARQKATEERMSSQHSDAYDQDGRR